MDGGTFPVAKIGDNNCTASYTPSAFARGGVLPSSAPILASLGSKPLIDSNTINDKNNLQPIATYLEALGPLNNRAPTKPRTKILNPREEDELLYFLRAGMKTEGAVKTPSPLLEPLLTLEEHLDSARYQNTYTTVCNNSALQLSTIFLGTTPAKGLVAVNQVPVFTGSDDDAEIENFNVIRSFCGSNMFAITNLYAPPNPPAINYIVNCTTNNVTYYGIEVYAGLGSALGYVYINGNITYEGQTSDSSQTAMATGIQAILSFCSYLYTTQAHGITRVNNLSGNININTSTLSLTTNQATNTILINGVGVIIPGPAGINIVCISGVCVVDNTGVVAITPGPGINSSCTSGTCTLHNTGVIAITPGPGISSSCTSGTCTLDNTGVVAITPGPGISSSCTSGTCTVTNTGVASINGQTGGFTFTAGSGISVVCTGGTCTWTNTNSGVGTVNGITGAVTISSPDNSVNITTSGQNIYVTSYAQFKATSFTTVAAGGLAVSWDMDVAGTHCDTTGVHCTFVTICFGPFTLIVGTSDDFISTTQTINTFLPGWANPIGSYIISGSVNMYSQAGGATKQGTIWIGASSVISITQPTGPSQYFWSAGDTITFGGGISPTGSLASGQFCMTYDTGYYT